jgi:hypothetical protein
MMRIVILITFLISSVCAGEAPRVLFDFENAEETASLAKSVEGAVVDGVSDNGVTSGKQSAKITLKKGEQWSSIALSGELLKGWENAESVCVDVFTEDAEGAELIFDVQDARSRDFSTRATQTGSKLAKGQQTLTWSLHHLKRNSKEGVAWEALSDDDKLDVRALTKVKIFTTPRADRDWTIYIDNVRLMPKSASVLDAERKEAEAAKAPEQTVYAADFQNDKGLGGEGVPFKGNWLPLDASVKAAIAAPLGTGNDSKKVLSVSTAKGSPACMELPLHGTIVEPEGWDGVVSLKIYNGGFASFQMTYSPVIPSDITFHRTDFTAPKGEWTRIEIPLDKFLYHERRPRRGCQLEYLCLIGMGPGDAGATFQFDDVRVYRTKRKDLPPPIRRPPLPEGVVYQQDFDGVFDFDIESFYPCTRNANAFRIDGGVAKDGSPLPPYKEGDAKPEAGCLAIRCYEKSQEFSGGRLIGFAGDNTVIEFDVRLSGVGDFAVVSRSASGKSRQYPKIADEKWTHVRISADEFAPYGVAPKDGVEKKLGKGQQFNVLFFSGTADASGNSEILIDNLVLRRGEIVK